MKDYNYNLWTLTELRKDDPRAYLDIIVFNARFGNIQAIEYQENKVFVISEEQYKKLQINLLNLIKMVLGAFISHFKTTTYRISYQRYL